MSDFDDFVDTGDLSPEEETRLRRVHDLLVQAGPPPDLSPGLERTPEAAEAEIVQFPLLPRRRWAVIGVAAATLAVIAFGGGYLFGHLKSNDGSFATKRVVPMQGTQSSGTPNALAVLRIAKADDVGNWPMELAVTGLPKQHTDGAYYELWLTVDHKPVEPCGSFRVHGKKTTVRFTVPYSFKHVDGWVITRQHGESTAPGPVVLST